jgi:hypothetical protein
MTNPIDESIAGDRLAARVQAQADTDRRLGCQRGTTSNPIDVGMSQLRERGVLAECWYCPACGEIPVASNEKRCPDCDSYLFGFNVSDLATLALDALKRAEKVEWMLENRRLTLANCVNGPVEESVVVITPEPLADLARRYEEQQHK